MNSFQKRQNDAATPAIGVLIIIMLVTMSLACVSVCADGETMVWNGKNWVSQKPPARGTPQGDINYIRELIEEGRYKTAIKEADVFLVNYAGTPACEEAMNLAGQACMDQGEYWAAYQRFEDQVAAYPNGAFFDRALDREYKIAEAFLNGRKRRALKILKLSAKDEGIDILLRISSHSPNSELGQRSLLRVADYHFNNRDYKDAINTYEDFEKQYPRSSRRAYAMLQTAKAYVNSYKGVSWDDTPLMDAKKKYEVFAAAYPRMAKQENVPEILKQIHEIRAHKVYNIADFYRRVHRPTAAVFYYQRTVDEFPGTEWAQTAREMLDMLAPDKTPEQRRQAPADENILKMPVRKYGLTQEITNPPAQPVQNSAAAQNDSASQSSPHSARDVIMPLEKMD
ncbi:MAG TPA: outer membrane protein assembly factor BamD, partial [Phycisphaerae bacterium]|nr:outer membrane protein assembly factor BamD [Phycisphaerae bacterium]